MVPIELNSFICMRSKHFLLYQSFESKILCKFVTIPFSSKKNPERFIFSLCWFYSESSNGFSTAKFSHQWSKQHKVSITHTHTHDGLKSKQFKCQCQSSLVWVWEMILWKISSLIYKLILIYHQIKLVFLLSLSTKDHCCWMHPFICTGDDSHQRCLWFCLWSHFGIFHMTNASDVRITSFPFLLTAPPQ